ncbi:MAG: DnaJ domain-containing protein [Thermovirga sp.]|nr:DnaJ domain-containing protein [Thermovirga sp.]
MFLGFKLLYFFLKQAKVHAGRAYNETWEKDYRQENKNRSERSYSFKDPYKVLGLSRSADEETIKRRYRELVAKYHPDKFIGQNLDKEFIDLATKKFQEIQEAYDKIRKERHF